MRLLTVFVTALLVFLALQYAEAKMDDARFEELKKDLTKTIKSDASGAKSKISELAQDDSDRAVDLLVSLSNNITSNAELIDAVQSAFNTMNSEEALKSISRYAKGGAGDYKMRIILLEALASKNGEIVVQTLLEAIDDSKDEVACTAIRALGDKRDENTIEPIISFMEKLARKKDRGRIYNDCRIALEKITGKKGPEEAKDWRNWYESYKTGGDSGGQQNPKPVLGGGDFKTSSFFGLTIDSDRIIFVIDVSGSMTVADPPPEAWVPDRDLGKLETTAVDEEEKKKKEKELEEIKKNWEKERQRIYRVKKELVRVIDSLDKSVKFNIIAFSDQISSWKDKLQPASSGNMSNAKAWVEALNADGLTCTDGAIREAFKDKDVDTVVLLSDGAPTHIGGEGRAEWGGHQDSMAIIGSIYSWLEENNKFRKVTIHTIGFKGANFEFMEKLAKDNNGTFRDIP
ncbi:MAG: hypothetical protein ABIH42_04460 [Planctomycetota bacterium]